MKEYLILLIKRESKVVLGKYYANLWLLTAVLLATFISIAFSHGSMLYLNEKMNDPFTMWVDIYTGDKNRSGNFDDFREALLEDEEVKNKYNFNEVQTDIYQPYMFYNIRDNQSHYLRCRFVENISGTLINKILEEDNLVNGCRIPQGSLDNSTLGFIITEDVMKKLGISPDTIPAYINFTSYASGADYWGFDNFCDEKENAPAPVPLLGVVKRLPSGMDVFGSFSYQLQRGKNNLQLTKEEYHRELYYYVEDNVENFKRRVESVIPDSLKRTLDIIPCNDIKQLKSWRNGNIVRVYVADRVNSPTSLFIDIDKKILSTYPAERITRLYNYKNSSDIEVGEQYDYLSLQFNDLNSIKAFEQFAKGFGVEIEMSQVNAKENFNSVTTMANVLSIAMIAFAIICIVMYIVNMMQNYFQKVKCNLGTFKAFGMGSMKLIGVYVLIIVMVLLVAIISSLLLAYGIELLLPLFGIMKDGTASYLALWNAKTGLSVIVVLLSTILTIFMVLNKMLGRTPGDLIYDRD